MFNIFSLHRAHFMPDQVSSVLPRPAWSMKLAYVPRRALQLIQQKCEHMPAPGPDHIPSAEQVVHRSGIPCQGSTASALCGSCPGPGTSWDWASSCPQPWPEQRELLVAVKVMLGHWRATHEPQTLQCVEAEGAAGRGEEKLCYSYFRLKEQ